MTAYDSNHASAPWRHGPKFVLSNGQALLIPLVLGLGLPLLIATVQIALLNTLLIFLFVLVAGLVLCHITMRKLRDRKLRLLGTFWLIKLGLTLFLLYVGWMPQLDPSASANWGYDPQRYYYYAHELIENGWNPTTTTNYQGIIFYYAAFFYLFGYNPVIPALINAFVTLLVTLYLIRVSYEFKGIRGPNDWKLAYLLLIPEILWYDVMTSREALTAALILGCTLTAGRYLVRTGKISLAWAFLIVALCLGAILAIRPSMALPVMVAIALMVLFFPSGKAYSSSGIKLVIAALVIGLLAARPLIQQSTGGNGLDYFSMLETLQSFDDNVASDMEMSWSENSIGLLLAPNNPWQAIFFTPPRMALYLIAPLPNVFVPVSDLMAGSWSAWQGLMTVYSSVLNIIVMPYALVGFSLAWRQRRTRPAPLVLHLTFWMTFLAIAGGNIIIHERYRVMMTLLLFACAWFGYTSCMPRQIRRFAYGWYGLLTAGALFYVGYKSM